jgi:hypothetical protein
MNIILSSDFLKILLIEKKTVGMNPITNSLCRQEKEYETEKRNRPTVHKNSP